MQRKDKAPQSSVCLEQMFWSHYSTRSQLNSPRSVICSHEEVKHVQCRRPEQLREGFSYRREQRAAENMRSVNSFHLNNEQ